MADQTAQSDEVVTQGDKDFRSAMLKFIVETLDRPCSDGDMIEEREREFDLFIARHRLASTTTLQASLDEAQAENARLRKTMIDVSAHLSAAISLLKKGGKAAKKAAPSNRMFDQMIHDYEASLNRARAALKETA